MPNYCLGTAAPTPSTDVTAAAQQLQHMDPFGSSSISRQKSETVATSEEGWATFD